MLQRILFAKVIHVMVTVINVLVTVINLREPNVIVKLINTYILVIQR